MTVFFPPQVLEGVMAASRAAWPVEACGLVLGRRDETTTWRVVAMDNLQDRLHAEDALIFPRDGRTAYVMDALKVQRLVDQAEAEGGGLVAIFHSHPQHPAYFSQTDERAARPFGAPTFPEAWQIVVSVYDAKVHDIKVFGWDSARGAFTGLDVDGLPPLPGPPPGASEMGDV